MEVKLKMDSTIPATVITIMGLLQILLGTSTYAMAQQHALHDFNQEPRNQGPPATEHSLMHYDNHSQMSNNNLHCPQQCNCFANQTVLMIQNCSTDPSGNLDSIILENLNITHLEIIRSKLTRLPDTVCNLTKLSVLNVSYNRLTNLPWTCLKELRLISINVSHNQIKYLNNGTLYDFNDLEHIHFSHNNISHVDLDVFAQPQRLPSLKRLYLDHNNLESIDTWPLQLLRNKSMNISLAKNDISNFTNYAGFEFKCEENEILKGRISFRWNRISHFVDLFNGWGIVNVNDKKCFIGQPGRKLLLAHNPLNCDCTDYEIYKLLFKAHSIIFGDDMHCDKPKKLYHKNIFSVQLDDLVCQVSENCPTHCDCLNIPNQRNLSIDCKGAGLTALPSAPLPNLPKSNYQYYLDMTHNRIKTLEYRPYLNKVSHAYLSHNEIGEVTTDFLNSLVTAKSISLDGNRLLRLPTNVTHVNMSEVNDIHLHDNRWMCDCHEKETRSWIIKHGNIISDREGILCKSPARLLGMNMILLPEDKFVCGDIWHLNYILVSACTSVAMLIICVILLASCYSKRTSIYRKFQWHPFDIDECTREEKEFDAFLAFSEEDCRYVLDYLIPELEQRGYKISHQRVNFMAGRPITDNVEDCIRRSKRTLAVLSNKFLQSYWCMFELTSAHEVDKVEGTQRLICISLCELNLDGLDPPIRAYLKKRSFIKFDSAHFWSKLEYYLPLKKNGKPTGNITGMDQEGNEDGMASSSSILDMNETNDTAALIT